MRQPDGLVLYDSINEFTLSGCNFSLLLRSIGAVVFGIVTSVPYFGSAEGFSDNKTMGVIYGVSEVIALTLFNSWLFNKIFLIMERQQIALKKTLCSTTVSLLPVLVLSAISATPDTYITYKFNNNAQYLAILAFLSDTISGLFSFAELRSYLMSIYKYGLQHQRDTQKMTMILEYGLTPLVHEQSDLSAHLHYFLNTTSVKTLLDNLVNRGIRQLDENNKRMVLLKLSSPIHFIISTALSLLWPIPWLLTLNIITKSALSKVGCDPIVAFMIACIPVVPVYTLAGIIISGLYNKLLDGANKIANKNFCSNFEYRFHPISYYIVKVLTWIAMILSFGTVGSMIKAAFGDNQIFLTGVTISLLISLRLYAASDFLNSTFRSLPSKTSDSNRLAHTRLHHCIGTTSGFLIECTPQQFAEFMTDINCDREVFLHAPTKYSLFDLCKSRRQATVDIVRNTEIPLLTNSSHSDVIEPLRNMPI